MVSHFLVKNMADPLISGLEIKPWLNYQPFDFTTNFSHLNTALVWYSDVHCVKPFVLRRKYSASTDKRLQNCEQVDKSEVQQYITWLFFLFCWQ
jgi:hypothetical protein